MKTIQQAIKSLHAKKRHGKRLSHQAKRQLAKKKLRQYKEPRQTTGSKG